MRLDLYLSQNGFSESRSSASEKIKNGQVFVNGKKITKPAFAVFGDENIECREGEIGKYVSRGGLKLEGALLHFGLSPEDRVCIDIGASTGGFTDCLLQNGAQKVYAVDSGTAQLHKKLQGDSRVISIENQNAKYISREIIPEPISFAVMDVSFISQTKLYGALTSVLCGGAVVLTLIKPQFEVGKSGIGKGGIVSDQKKRTKAVNDVISSAKEHGLICKGTVQSQIQGGDGNIEYIGYFVYSEKEGSVVNENRDTSESR